MIHDVSLKQLTYVEAAGRLGSIARASESLAISQSSITAAIDGLETRLGFDLFTRVPARGIRPTPAGVEALALIARFLDQAAAFRAELGSVGGVATGVVRVACFASAAANFLPALLRAFAAEFPSVDVRLVEGDMDEAIDHIRGGRADLAFTYEEVVGAGAEFAPLVDAPAYALLPLSDPLAGRRTLALSELEGRPMIALSLARTRDYYTDLFRRVGLAPNVVHASSSVEMIRTLVAAGLGFTLLNARPPGYVQDDARFRAVPLRGEVPARRFGMATPSGTRPPKAVAAFRQTVAEMHAAGGFEHLAVRSPKN
ncbi:LysR family transcriptional regulator [Jannaschia sp. S6380]|uniref:LysR family transcriptional regulator n=1 Tax=Jannaschia sp. S6380 TaxID=2926408 RepID=UPI001FF5A2F6|nr:LysR family transcriptional regulator [Jannaschia sp. S6380]MCK0167205.1 LysR family transcriptional regulator [Jannaschia sp. S6380]